MNSRPKVLLLLNDCSSGGATRMAWQIFQGLPAELDLRIIALDGGEMLPEFQNIAPTLVLSQLGASWLGQLLLRADARLPGTRGAWLRVNGRMVPHLSGWRGWQPDVVYVNGIAALSLTRFLPLAHRPAILHLHETGSTLAAFRRRAGRVFDEWPQRFLVVSEHARESLESQGIAPQKIHVASNFLAPPVASELSHLAQTRPPRDPNAPFVVGGSGYLSWFKGPDLWLLMARQMLSELGPQRVRFCWVGARPGEDLERFEIMSQKLELQKSLTVVPLTPRPFEHYATFDAFAFCSWEDSFGLAVLENLALGNLVSCFAGGGGAPEVMADAGLIVPDFNPTEMAARLAQTLTDDAAREEFRRRSVKRAGEFDARRGAAEIARHIREVAQTQGF